MPKGRSRFSLKYGHRFLFVGVRITFAVLLSVVSFMGRPSAITRSALLGRLQAACTNFPAEVVYFPKTLDMCTTLFDPASTCNSSKRKPLALTLHMGGLRADRQTLELWRRYVWAVRASRIDTDIYLNTNALETAATVLKGLGDDLYVTVSRRNYGMDVSGFMHSLAAMQRNCVRYDVVLKVHSKQDIEWLRSVVDPLLGSTSRLKHLVHVFNAEPSLGLVFGEFQTWSGAIKKHNRFSNIYQFHAGDLNQFAFTSVPENSILDDLGISIDYNKRSFVGGNLYAIRGDVIMDRLPVDVIQKALQKLNDHDSFDENWFGIMSRSYENATEVRKKAPFSSAPGNSLMAHHDEGMLRDAQLEHAWERVFAYLPISAGLRIKVFQKVAFAPLIIHDVTAKSAKLKFNRHYNEGACTSHSIRASCLTKSLAGECVMQPSTVGAQCALECACVHRSTRPRELRSQLSYLLNNLHAMRLAGPFYHVARNSQHYIDCLTTRHASQLLTYNEVPIVLSSTWRLPLCSRIVGSDGSEVFLSARGDVIYVRDTLHNVVFLHSAAIKRKPDSGYVGLTAERSRCKLVLSLKFRFREVRRELFVVPCVDRRLTLTVNKKEVTLLTVHNVSHVWNYVTSV